MIGRKPPLQAGSLVRNKILSHQIRHQKKKSHAQNTEFYYFYKSAEKVISLTLLIWQLHVDFSNVKVTFPPGTNHPDHDVLSFSVQDGLFLDIFV